MDPRFPAGLPFPVPEILEFVAFRDSGKFFQKFSRDFPGVFLGNPRIDPGNSHSLLKFSEDSMNFGKAPRVSVHSVGWIKLVPIVLGSVVQMLVPRLPAFIYDREPAFALCSPAHLLGSVAHSSPS